MLRCNVKSAQRSRSRLCLSGQLPPALVFSAASAMVAAHSSQNCHRTVPDCSPTVIILRERTLSLRCPHLWHFIAGSGTAAATQSCKARVAELNSSEVAGAGTCRSVTTHAPIRVGKRRQHLQSQRARRRSAPPC
jgi:hypothetical protein